MHKRLASEMACFAIYQRGSTTPLKNDLATISLYADKGDLSFLEKESSLCCALSGQNPKSYTKHDVFLIIFLIWIETLRRLEVTTTG